MHYELWDVDIGNGIARYDNEREMATLVRTLAESYGDAYAEDLDLTVEDANGAVRESLSGAGLIEWANGVLHVDTNSAGSPSLIASSIKAVRSRVRGLAASPAKRDVRRRDRGDNVSKSE